MPNKDKDSVSRLLGELGRLDCSVQELAEIFTALVEHSPVPLWIFDRDGLIVYNNLASCRFGTGNNVIGSCVGAFSADIQAMLKVGLASAQETQEPCAREGWIESPIIGIRFLRFNFLPLPKGLAACLSYDLTDNKHIEEALHASEERVRFFADNLERALVPFGAAYPDGRLMTVNQAFCVLTGYREEDLPKLSLFRELTDPSSREVEGAALQQLWQSGLPQRYEKEILRQDGSLVPAEVFIQQVSDNEGQVQYVFFFITDITVRRRAEQLLRESEHRLALALEGAADGIWDFNPQTGVIFRSSHMAAQLGYGAEGLAPTPEAWLEIVHPDDLAEVQEAWQAHLDGRTEQYCCEHRLRATNGEYLWVLDSGRVVRRDDTGRPLRVAGTYKNITELKCAEEERRALEEQLRQSQKMEAIGTMAGGIAHDFNNILFAILGYAELVREDLAPESLAFTNIEGLISAGKRARGLVQQILTFSRKSHSAPVPLNVNTAIREVVKLISATLPSTLEIQLHLEPLSAIVMADPIELQQVLLNLSTNAAQAVGDRTGQLDISSTQVEIGRGAHQQQRGLEPGLYVKLEVRDDGCGMAPQVLERIFEPFFTTKEKGKGTGLGLSMVHGIVHRMGGAIAVESVVGEGSLFVIYLPAHFLPELKANAEDQFAPAGTGHILLVDDEPDVITVLTQHLQALGYQVTDTLSAVAALEYVRSEPRRFDAVIVDQTMPQLPGLQLASELHHVQPNLPVILISGFSDAVNPEQLKLHGIAEYLYKPICKSDLANSVYRALLRGGSSSARATTSNPSEAEA